MKYMFAQLFGRAFSAIRWVLPAALYLAATALAANATTLQALQASDHPLSKAWQLSAYNDPTIEARDNAVRICGSGKPAGLYFRQMVDPSKTYALTVEGHPIISPVTFRLKFDNNVPQWLPAPIGSKRYIVSNIRLLEVLIYADSRFAYNLTAMTLAECSDCKAEAAKKARAPAPQFDIPIGAISPNRLHFIKTYEHIAVSRQDTAVRISNDGGTGGLFLNYTLNPEDRYRITINGRAVAGNPSLRVRMFDRNGDLRNRGYEYARPPNGMTSFVVDKVERLEVLIYGQGSYTYDLESLSIDSCSACQGDAELKAYLTKKVPGLQDALQRDRKRAALLLLNWAANRVDFSTSPRLPEHILPNLIFSSAADTYFEVFQKDKGAVFCGGAAIFYDKVLKLFGYNSFTIDFGDSQDFTTHVTVIVAFREAGEWQHFIFDPTFNARFVTAQQSRDIDIAELVRLNRKGEFQRISVKERSMSKRQHAYLVSDNHVMSKSVRASCQPGEYLGEAGLLCKRPEFNFKTYLNNFRVALERKGFSQDVVGFLKLLENRVYSIGPTINDDARASFLEKLDRLGIPHAS